MNLDPRLLLTLLTISRTGGIVSAAEELYLSAPAVSQQLTRLEREVGAELVTRTPRGSVLTPTGRIVVDAAEEVERALNLIESRMLEGASGTIGRIRVGSFPSLLRSVIVPQLPLWSDRYPGLEIHLEEHNKDAAMRLLNSGDLDAVLLDFNPGEDASSMIPNGIREELLLEEPWRLVVPAGSAPSSGSADLRTFALPWLGTEESFVNLEAVRRIQRSLGAPLPSVHRYQEVTTALAMVRAGQGMIVMPLLALHDLNLDGVDVLEIPGLGARRIVLRRLESKQSGPGPIDTFVTLVRAAGNDFWEAQLKRVKPI